MAGGVLELAKTRVISEGTRDLDDEHAWAVGDAVVDEAPRLNQKDLIDAVETAAAQIDPEWAARRLAAAAARADVYGQANPSGTATIYARDLDPEGAWGAMARVEALALELRGMLRAHGVTSVARPPCPRSRPSDGSPRGAGGRPDAPPGRATV